jgi:excisionase family DNA binding protein
MTDEKIWLNTEEAAQMLGLDDETLRIWARNRKHLPYSRVGRQYRFKRADIEALLARTVEPQARAA